MYYSYRRVLVAPFSMARERSSPARPREQVARDAGATFAVSTDHLTGGTTSATLAGAEPAGGPAKTARRYALELMLHAEVPRRFAVHNGITRDELQE